MLRNTKKQLNEFILDTDPNTVVVDHLSFSNDIRQPTISDMLDAELNSLSGKKQNRPDNLCYLLTISGRRFSVPWAYFMCVSCFDVASNTLIVEDVADVVHKYEINSYLMSYEKSFYSYKEEHKDRISVLTNLQITESIMDTVILEIHKIYNPYEL